MLSSYDSGDRPLGIPLSQLDTAQHYRPREGRRQGRPADRKPSPRENAAVARKRTYARELRAGALDRLSTPGAFQLAYNAARPERLKAALPALAKLPDARVRTLAALARLGDAPPLLTLDCAARTMRTTVEGARWVFAALVKADLVEAVPYFVPNYVPDDLEHLADPELRRAAVTRKLPHSERGKVYRLAAHVREALRLLRRPVGDGKPAFHSEPQPSPKGLWQESEPSGSAAPAAAAPDARRPGDHVLSMAARACGKAGRSTGQGRITGAARPETRQAETRNVARTASERVVAESSATLRDELQATAVALDDPDLREIFDELRVRLDEILDGKGGGGPTS